MTLPDYKLLASLGLLTLLLILSLPANSQAQSSLSTPDIIWQADTLVPVDYPGKALPIRGSTIVAQALIDHPNSNSLSYQWSLDEQFFKALSGAVGSSFSFQVIAWPREHHQLRLAVSDSSGQTTSRTVLIPVIEPEIHLSPNPLSISRGVPFVTQAIPYFFSHPDLSYQWLFNFQPAGPGGSDDILTLNIGGSYQLPRAKLDLVVTNPHNIFETIRRRTIVKIE